MAAPPAGGDTAAVAAAFEQAALDSQVPATRVAAEASLAALVARPDVVDVSLSVVYGTRSPIARYHAATALRAAVLARWDALPAPARHSPADALRARLVAFALSRPIHAFERSAVLRAAAAFARRAYPDEPPAARAAFFRDVCAAAAAAAPPPTALAALEMLSMLVAEFAAPSARDAASAYERGARERARASFAARDGELFMIFRAADAALAALHDPATPAMPPESMRAVAHHALSVLSDVLSFDVDACGASSGAGSGDAAADEDRPSHVAYVVNRAHEWHPVLHDCAALVPRLFRLAEIVRSGDDYGCADVSRVLHETLNALAAVSRKSYPTPEVADAVLVAFLRGVEQRDWSASTPRQERLMYAELWRRFCVAHGANHVARVAPGVLESFARNTVSLFRARTLLRTRIGLDGASEEDWSAECDCLLLETWAGLCLEASSHSDAGTMRKYIASVVSEFIDQSLSCRRSGERETRSQEVDEEEDFGFDDESHEAAQLEAAAVLCRFAADPCLGQLASLVEDLSKHVFLSSGSAGNPVTSASSVAAIRASQDDLVWVLRLSGAALADEGFGESPEVPIAFVHAPHNFQSNVTMLLTSLLGAAELESSTFRGRSHGSVADVAVSPRIESAMLDCLSRLAKTYLIPSSAVQENQANALLGGEDCAGRARAMALSKSVFGLCERGFEPDVALSAAELLVTLAPGRSSGRYLELNENARWHPLPSLGLESFETLPSEATEKLGICLSLFYGDQVASYIVHPACNALTGLGERQGNVADAAERALVALHLLDGVARCVQVASYVHEALTGALRSPNGGAVSAVRAFSRINASVPIAVIKLAQDVVACHMPLLRGEAATLFFTDCIKLVGETVKAVSSHSSSFESDDVAGLAAILLSLLRRLVELHCEASTRSAAFFGFNMALSLLTDEVLSYPDVKPTFSALVSELAVAYPEYVPELPVEVSSRLLTSIQVGCQSYEGSAMRHGLEAVTAIAAFRARHPHLRLESMPSLPVLDSALDSFLTHILEGLTFGGGRFTGVLNFAADALLALLLRGERARKTFESVGRALMSRASEDSARATVAMLETLDTESQKVGPILGYVGSSQANGMPPSSSPAARNQARDHFRDVVHKFVFTTRLPQSSSSV